MIATVVLHDRWRIYDNPSQRAAEIELFASQLAIVGGLLMLIGMGPARLRSITRAKVGAASGRVSSRIPPPIIPGRSRAVAGGEATKRHGHYEPIKLATMTKHASNL
jgi:hypothetical protein